MLFHSLLEHQGTKLQILALFQYLKLHSPDIVLLQETHLMGSSIVVSHQAFNYIVLNRHHVLSEIKLKLNAWNNLPLSLLGCLDWGSQILRYKLTTLTRPLNGGLGLAMQDFFKYYLASNPVSHSLLVVTT